MDIKMQETRTLKDLYEILWDDIKDSKYISGICARIKQLPISQIEYNLLSDHFMSQRHLHPEFKTELRNWDFSNYASYWWDYIEDENPVNRKAFIQKIISTLN